MNQSICILVAVTALACGPSSDGPEPTPAPNEPAAKPRPPAGASAAKDTPAVRPQRLRRTDEDQTNEDP